MMVRAFRTAEREAAFFNAYDAVLAKWPVPVEPVDLTSDFGTTRVHASGPASGPPLLLLHGGGATATVWVNNVDALAATHRVYALDVIGGPGRSVHDGREIRTPADLMTWLDTVFDGLGVDRAALAGHSYGAWMALSCALHAPRRVDRLALLDPTSCFGGMNAGYRLRAIPVMARPNAERMKAFLRWETGGVPLDPDWLDLVGRGAADFPQSRIVLPRQPDPAKLRALTAPTLLVLAERSRMHDIRQVGDTARRLVPDLTTVVLPGATHHTIPIHDPEPLNRALTAFLAR
jgi:pimeloyl-ACP methyl ester carboxylesterase